MTFTLSVLVAGIDVEPHLNAEHQARLATESSLFQTADLCCTLHLLRQKIATDGLSSSERDFFRTPARQALQEGYFKAMDRKRFVRELP